MDSRRTPQTPSPGGAELRWYRRAASTAVLWLQRVFAFVSTLFVGWAIYWLLLAEIDDGGRQLWGFLAIWVLASYILLPRLNRILARIYVPDYFIGRTRTVDGLLGDPVNLAVIGAPEELQAAMLAAGWTEADPVTLGSSWHIIRASLLRRSYPSAPVSPLFVFGAATFDRKVGRSLFTFQITHKIAENTDQERNRVVAALRSVNAMVHTVRHFSTGYHSRNGGGDAIETDGDLPIVYVGAPSGATCSVTDCATSTTLGRPPGRRPGRP